MGALRVRRANGARRLPITWVIVRENSVGAARRRLGRAVGMSGRVVAAAVAWIPACAGMTVWGHRGNEEGWVQGRRDTRDKRGYDGPRGAGMTDLEGRV